MQDEAHPINGSNINISWHCNESPPINFSNPNDTITTIDCGNNLSNYRRYEIIIIAENRAYGECSDKDTMYVTFVRPPTSVFKIIPPRCFGEPAVLTAHDTTLNKYIWGFEGSPKDLGKSHVVGTDTNPNGGEYRKFVYWDLNPTDTVRGQTIEHIVSMYSETYVNDTWCPGMTIDTIIPEPRTLEEPPCIAKDTCGLERGAIIFNCNIPTKLVTYTWLDTTRVGWFESNGRSHLPAGSYQAQRKYQTQNVDFISDYERLWGSYWCIDTISYKVDTVGMMHAVAGISAIVDVNSLIAPAEVTFINTSDYGNVRKRCEWHFGDGSSVVRDCNEIVKHTYERPGEYKPYLIIMNSDLIACRDTAKLALKVDNSSRLEVPNVFTPNGDGFNDYFQVDAESLKTFQGEIRNRWGERLFRWEKWEKYEDGWNGDNAPTGIYYYIIKAVGLDDVTYEFEGFLHLIRD
jgi:gliding motility-associated-like protein